MALRHRPKYVGVALVLGLALLSFSVVSAYQAADAKGSSKVQLTITGKASDKTNTIKIKISNPKGSGYDIYELQLVPTQEVTKAKGPTGWKSAPTTEEGISFFTESAPIKPGKQATFQVSSSSPIRAILWGVTDSDQKVLDGGIKSTNIKGYPSQTLVNERYGYSFSYPGHWFEYNGLGAEMLGPPGAIYTNIDYRPQDPRPTMNVGFVIESMQGHSFEEYIRLSKEGLKSHSALKDYVIVKEGKMKLGGKDAYFIEQSYSSIYLIKAKTVLTPVGGNAYIFTYVTEQKTYGNHVKDFDKMMSSFKFLS